MEERERAALLDQAFAQESWYHTIELAPGRVTPGLVDLRSAAPGLLPTDLDGLRALDVGAFDGFWAFELERRGADVVAADLDDYLDSDWPPPTRRRLAPTMAGRTPGERFALAHELLGSRVRRIGCSIYDLTPERMGGRFDFVVVGALLLHLRDPVAGLEAVHSVL
jgi:SAM-dependent methyltransferase